MTWTRIDPDPATWPAAGVRVLGHAPSGEISPVWLDEPGPNDAMPRWRDDADYLLDFVQVTHWHPLPEPPPNFTDTPPPTDAQVPRGERVIRDVRAEMARAEALHGPLTRQRGRAIPFRPGDGLACAAADLERWARHDLENAETATTFAILAEEVGELARATPSEAYQEAIQVAAVALRMAVVVAP